MFNLGIARPCQIITHWRSDRWVRNWGSGSAWRAVIMVRHWPVDRSVLGDQLRQGGSLHKLLFLLTYISYYCEQHRSPAVTYSY